MAVVVGGQAKENDEEQVQRYRHECVCLFCVFPFPKFGADSYFSLLPKFVIVSCFDKVIGKSCDNVRKKNKGESWCRKKTTKITKSPHGR